MSLDDFTGSTDEDIVEQFLWGPGHNRWVDKSFSVLITNEGKCGLNFDFCLHFKLIPHFLVFLALNHKFPHFLPGYGRDRNKARHFHTYGFS